MNAEEEKWLSLADAWLAEHQEELLAHLPTWLAVPSISESDKAIEGAPYGEPCAAMLKLALRDAEEAGFKVEEHQGYAGSVIYGDNPLEIGLVSHLDVVPPGEGWIYDPFIATQKDNFLIARGSVDDKSAALGNLYLLRMMRDLKVPLRHSVRLIYGLAEETGMSDMQWYAQHCPVPLVSIVTDGYFPVNTAQKGQLNVTLAIKAGPTLSTLRAGKVTNSVPDSATIALGAHSPLRTCQDPSVSQRHDSNILYLDAKGIAGHAAFPEGSRNAAIVLLDELIAGRWLAPDDEAIAKKLSAVFGSPWGDKTQLACEDAVSGKLTINAGVWRPAEQADSLHVDIDIRFPVSWRAEQIVAALTRALAGIEVSIVDQKVMPAFYISPESPVVALLMDSYNQLQQTNSEPYAMGGGTHSRVLPRAITFGPAFPGGGVRPTFLPKGHGSPHSPDEALHIPSFIASLRIYFLALLRLDACIMTAGAFME